MRHVPIMYFDHNNLVYYMKVLPCHSACVAKADNLSFPILKSACMKMFSHLNVLAEHTHSHKVISKVCSSYKLWDVILWLPVTMCTWVWLILLWFPLPLEFPSSQFLIDQAQVIDPCTWKKELNFRLPGLELDCVSFVVVSFFWVPPPLLFSSKIIKTMRSDV